MSEQTLKDRLSILGSNVRIFVANQWNGGFAAFRDMDTGEPIDGCYLDGPSEILRSCLKKSLRSKENIDDELSFLLAELVWSVGRLVNTSDRKTWDEVYAKSDSFSRLDKIRWCNSTMDSLDKFFEADIPHKIHEEPKSFFRPHVVKKASSF